MTRVLCAALMMMTGWGCGPSESQAWEEQGSIPATLGTTTGSMVYRREKLTLTPLPNGKALAAGGHGMMGYLSNSAVLATAELYDPATGTWSLTGSMSVARFGHTATLLPNGKVLVVGGSTATQTYASAELYDPATGTWSLTGSMSWPRSLHTATLLEDGRVLVVGGGASSPLASCELYDPATGQWSSTGSMSDARRGHAAARSTSGGKVVVMGGWSGSAASVGFEVYNPTTGTWSIYGSTQAQRLYHRAFALQDGRVLVAGGESATGGAFYSTLLLSPNTGSWTTAGSLVSIASNMEGVVLENGKVLILGGYQGSSTYSKNTQLFDPATLQWTLADPLLEGRGSYGLARLSDGRLLVAGGEGFLSSAELHPTSCTPTTCAAQGATCGTLADGCGGTLSCGTCATGEICSSVNTCCMPTTCAALGATCGTVSNGCGGTLSCGTCAEGERCTNNACAFDPTLALFDPATQAPRCGQARTACDSGTLLDGRGPLGPEAHAPNTLGASCTDGTAGTYHLDESLDALRVESVDGQVLTAGRQARIVATVWASAYYNSDRLYLYAASDAANPGWTLLTSLVPPGSGRRTLTATYTLPFGVELQAVRATFRRSSSSSSACSTGSYDDHDDLAFFVTHPEDLTTPVATLTAPTAGSTLSGTATLSATATDDVGVQRVEFLDGASLLGSDTTAPYSLSWDTRTTPNGAHQLAARAYDFAGRVTTSALVEVTVANDLTPPTVSLLSPVAGATVSGTVSLTASASDNGGTVSRVDYYDGTTLLGTSTVAPYSVAWNTQQAANGAHQLTARAYDPAGNPGTSTAVGVTVSNTATAVMATYDSVRRAPGCTVVGTSCDTGTLVQGRGTVGPEQNASNTLNGSCVDGNGGSYHVDESVDRLRVSTVSGAPFAAGQQVRVEATVWVWGTSDKLDLYYTANADNPSWSYLTTISPTVSGTQTFSTTYTLPAGARQAVRANFRYGGSASPCSPGSYDDRDDLVFLVQ
ncbi:Ig-like domain-containing protein [Archangium gephyra]|uniref:Ig-like domain-containing protein n=1 Tax=Archangium gephyra TaxID=48 RepID=UPI0035D4DA1E